MRHQNIVRTFDPPPPPDASFRWYSGPCVVAQASIGNGPFLPMTTHLHLGTAIQANQWHHVTAKFNSARCVPAPRGSPTALPPRCSWRPGMGLRWVRPLGAPTRRAMDHVRC